MNQDVEDDRYFKRGTWTRVAIYAALAVLTWGAIWWGISRWM